MFIYNTTIFLSLELKLTNMVSLLTVLTIQENDTIVSTYQERGSDKFGFAITLGEDRRYRPLLTSQPIYGSTEEAKQCGDDVVGSSSEVVDFMGDIEEIAAQDTLEGTQNAGLRAVAPAAAKIGWDLGRFTKSVEMIKEEDERISNLFDADAAWAEIDGQKTRVMYKEKDGTYYVVKVGVL